MKAIYAGSFSPPTLGHLDIIRRGAAIFDRVIVGVLVNAEKKCAFTMEERFGFLCQVTAGLPNVEVITFSGLTAELCRRLDVQGLVRGLRGSADLENERKDHCHADDDQQQVNADIAGNGTVRMPAGNQVLFHHDLFAAQLRQTVKLITTGSGSHRLVRPVLINLAVDFQAVIEVEYIAAVVLQDDGNLAAYAAPADVVHAVHSRIGPLN